LFHPILAVGLVEETEWAQTNTQPARSNSSTYLVDCLECEGASFRY
jgi:hypothetical protein